MLKNIQIGLKLCLGFGVVLALLVLLGGMGIVNQNILNGQVQLLVQDRWPKAEHANAIIYQINIVARALRNALLTNDATIQQKEMNRIPAASQAVAGHIGELRKTMQSEEGKARLKTLTDSQTVYTAELKNVLSLVDSGKKEAATAMLFGKFREAQSAYLAAGEELVSFQGQEITLVGSEAGKTHAASWRITLALMGMALLLGGGIACLVSRSITQPVRACIEAADKKDRLRQYQSRPGPQFH